MRPDSFRAQVLAFRLLLPVGRWVAVVLGGKVCGAVRSRTVAVQDWLRTGRTQSPCTPVGKPVPYRKAELWSAGTAARGRGPLPGSEGASGSGAYPSLARRARMGVPTGPVHSPGHTGWKTGATSQGRALVSWGGRARARAATRTGGSVGAGGGCLAGASGSDVLRTGRPQSPHRRNAALLRSHRLGNRCHRARQSLGLRLGGRTVKLAVSTGDVGRGRRVVTH